MQAKRYSRENKVKGNEIREFIGAMTLKGARKGVFITSSMFAEQAKSHIKELREMSISLIDGKHLSSLLIEHNLGVKEVGSFTTYTVDKEEFFE